MNGPVFFGLGILLLVVMLILGLTPIFLVPIVVLIGAGLFFGVGATLMRALGGGPAGAREPAGVPSTEDAAYDPTRDVAERPL